MLKVVILWPRNSWDHIRLFKHYFRTCLASVADAACITKFTGTDEQRAHLRQIRTFHRAFR